LESAGKGAGVGSFWWGKMEGKGEMIQISRSSIHRKKWWGNKSVGRGKRTPRNHLDGKSLLRGWRIPLRSFDYKYGMEGGKLGEKNPEKSRKRTARGGFTTKQRP